MSGTSPLRDIGGITPASEMGRRRFLARLVTAIHTVIGSVVAFVAGGAALAPAFRRRQETWLPAGELDRLPENQPVAVTLRIAREDGYAQVVDRTVVYLVRVGEHDVRALQSTCTHLGCRTSYDRRARRIVCPCHGGVFDVQGNVVAGPPPAPLPALPTRIDGGQVMVRV